MAAPVRIAVCEEEEPDEGFEVEFEEKETGTAVMVEDMVDLTAKSVKSMFCERCLRGDSKVDCAWREGLVTVRLV